MAFKRKRTSLPSWGRKKRRTTRYKRVGYKGKRTTTFGTRTLNATNAFKYRSKKLSKKRWRNLLWNETLSQQHYKTVINSLQAVNTPTGTTQLGVTGLNALSSVTGSEFWKTTGGLQDPGFGIIPPWGGASGTGVPEPLTIVIRGGRIFCNIVNNSATDTVNVRVQLVFPKQQLRSFDDSVTSNTYSAWIAAIAGVARPYSWSLQDAPDYSEYLHPPVIDKTMDLKPGDDLNIFWKVRVTKIDADAFKRSGGWFPQWIVYCNQRNDVTVGANTLACDIGHNMSFAMTSTTY